MKIFRDVVPFKGNLTKRVAHEEYFSFDKTLISTVSYRAANVSVSVTLSNTCLSLDALEQHMSQSRCFRATHVSVLMP